MPFFGKLLFLGRGGGFWQKWPVFWGSRFGKMDFFWGGALPDNGILEKHLTQLCVALFNAAHSLFSLNRCLETGSCLLFWMSTKCQHTHTLPFSCPTAFSPLCAPFDACCWARMPAESSFTVISFPFFSLLSSHFFTLHSPAPPASLGIWGVWNAQSMQYSWTQMYFFF